MDSQTDRKLLPVCLGRAFLGMKGTVIFSKKRIKYETVSFMGMFQTLHDDCTLKEKFSLILLILKRMVATSPLSEVHNPHSADLLHMQVC